ncbi:MAG: ATP-dependent RecD-like DNA helicase [Lachnospiraceae bacterium]|nr:ATP-dependent RecD-like DNA helicase [Lachnospiraceae bacterium]
MKTLSGYIDHIIFRNEDNGYTVFELAGFTDSFEEGNGEPVVCYGNLQPVDEGELIELSGEFTEHALYGEQFHIIRYEMKLPQDETAVIRYLGSGAVKGVGQALAERIVRRFKEDTFRVIEEEPERLAEIKGISEKKARAIAVLLAEKKELRQALIFLQHYGIGGTLAEKVYKKYVEGIYRILKENPYRLAEDIEGIGFRTADEIASKAGIRPDSDYRVRCGVLFALQEALSDGHCYLPRDVLLKNCESLLRVDREVIWIQTQNLAMDKKLVIREQDAEICVYESSFYYLELLCARKLKDLDLLCEDNPEAVEKRLRRIEEQQAVELDPIQRVAVQKAVMNGVTVITGGPGTGKTTIINMILKYFEGEEADIILCAPTGRAAKRMSEATGYEAATIQRILHLTPRGDGDISGHAGYYYGKNEEEPLEADVVIVDEMSMVDISLFASLLKAVLPGTRLILVGDTDQLPSVGPGAVLKDIIRSGQFADTTVILKKIFRQAGESDIIVNAHKINRGEQISLDNRSRDFFFIERNNVNQILKNIVILARDKLPGFVNASPFDIQVLTPMKKGTLGVESLNPILQKYLNPPSARKREKEISGVIYREGDKVMQMKNNYQLTWQIKSRHGIVVDQGEGVFNGDTGVIREIDDFAETMTVEYDGARRVVYPYEELSELSLSYAVTIHKSQGSEYPAVILPIFNGPNQLFYRNLLYTGVTRAVRCVVLIGSRERISYMINNADEHKRYTGFAGRLKEL